MCHFHYFFCNSEYTGLKCKDTRFLPDSNDLPLMVERGSVSLNKPEQLTTCSNAVVDKESIHPQYLSHVIQLQVGEF